METRATELSDSWSPSNHDVPTVAEVDVETRVTELSENKNQSSNPDTEVDLRPNHHNAATASDGDETHRRCYSCYVCCNACCKQCMTEHNPLPDSPTRFDILLLLLLLLLL